MAKNAVAKSWTPYLWGDGTWRSYQEVAGSAPFIVGQDFTAGPTTGGDSNNGCYLTLYVMNAGSFSDYGTSNFVTIDGNEVAGYCCLQDVFSPSAAAIGVKRLTVQVGSTAVKALTAGTEYAVSVTVGGVGPSNSTSGGFYLAPFSGENISFIPQPGAILFVSSSGNNANPGTRASPLLDLQTSSGTAGAFKIATSQNSEAGIVPGTHVIVLSNINSTTGVNGRLIDKFRITGRPATGASQRGPICMTGDPGLVGTNSPPTIVLSGSNINGNDSTRAVETTTAWGGGTGWNQYMQTSNLTLNVDASYGSDHGPFNTQCHSQYERIWNCECTWPSTQTSPQGRSGGIEGSPVNFVFGLMYIHNIDGAGGEANTQHGIYLNGFSSGSGNVAHDGHIIMPHIEDIGFGNGIQLFDGVNGGGMRNIFTWNPFIKNVAKHGLNVADNTQSFTSVNPVIVEAGEDGIRVSTSGVIASNGIVFMNPTVYGWGMTTSSRYGFRSESVPGGGSSSILVRNGIFCQKASHSANSYSFYTSNTGVVIDDNQWYDPDGRLTTKPSGDTAGAYGNPLFNNVATDDFSLQDGSPCIDSGTTPGVVTRSYDFLLQPAPDGTVDRGAYERAA